MNRIILLISLLFAMVQAQSVNWAKSYNDALLNAQKENKPVLFISSRHSCKYCVILEQTTFQDTKVVKELNSDFVSYTSYSDDGDFMPQELWRPGTPAIWFLLPSGEPMFEPLMGAVDAQNFLKALEIVKEEYKTAQGKKNK